MSALLEGRNNGSELEAFISEQNRSFIIIFLIFFALQKTIAYKYIQLQKFEEVVADLSCGIFYSHCHGKDKILAGLETMFATEEIRAKQMAAVSIGE